MESTLEIGLFGKELGSQFNAFSFAAYYKLISSFHYDNLLSTFWNFFLLFDNDNYLFNRYEIR